MHFDQFNAVKKEKKCISLPLTPFSGLSHNAHFQTKTIDKSIAFFKYTGVCFTKVFRTELGHKYILVECSVIALCLPLMSEISHYKLVCYK